MNEDKLDKAIRDIEQAKSMSSWERFIKVMPRKKYIPLHLISFFIWILLRGSNSSLFRTNSVSLIALSVLLGAWTCALVYYRAVDAGRGKGRYWAFSLFIPIMSFFGLIYSFYLYFIPSRPCREWDNEKLQWR